MPSCVKIRFENIITIFLALLFLNLPSHCHAQELLPEMNLLNGLQSNTVRAVKIDQESRLWVGTDNGLDIFNANSSAQKTIIFVIGNQSVSEIAFGRSFVFIGTLYDGLYIFNKLTGNLFQHLPFSAVSRIRKIKVFNEKVFILTDEKAFRWSPESLTLLNFEATKSIPHLPGCGGDFISDIFNWKGNLYATTFFHGLVFKYEKDAFTTNATDNFLPPNMKREGLLCAQSNADTIVFGGDGFYWIISGKEHRKILIPQTGNLNYAVSDIAFIKNKIFLVLGESLNNEGFVYEAGTSFNANKKASTGLLSSIAYDEENDCFYAGSVSRGVYMQKSIAERIFFDEVEPVQIVAEGNRVFSFGNYFIKETSQFGSGEKISINFSKKTGKITNVKIFGDTMVVTTELQIICYDLKKKKTFFKINQGASDVALAANRFYFFELNGKVFELKRDENKIRTLSNLLTFLPHAQSWNNRIIFLNREKGFSIIEKDSAYSLTCRDKSIAFSAGYAIVKNDLFLLLKNSIKSYRIDLNTRQLIPKSNINLDDLVEGFSANWILAKNDKLYLLNDNGILQFSPSANKVTGYYYFGNYHEIPKPLVDGDSLLIVTKSVITKISFADIDHQKISASKGADFTFPENVNENLTFKITIEYPGSIVQDHSLKTLKLFREGEFFSEVNTLNDEIHFPAGLKYGNYELHLLIGDTEIVKSLHITLPYNRDPKVFMAIGVIVLAILFLFLKIWLDKKKFKKKISETRLQILKQNLNPHFVFNSMNLISSLILEKKNDEAIKVVADFSDLERTYLENNNKDSITLHKELEFLESYLKLQRRRFSHDNGFEFSISVDPSIDTNLVLLPPLILQPLAENAVKYGVIASKANEKRIWIDVRGADPLIISIEDNGRDVSKKKGFGLGHQIVQERISLFKAPVTFVKNASPLHSSTGYRVEIHVGKLSGNRCVECTLNKYLCH